MKKRFIYFAAAAAMLAGCSETDELAKNQLSEVAEDGAVAFSVYTNRAVTRAGKAGVLNTESLQKPDGGFGVFAYHTNNSFYDSQNSEVNFMYNQKVTWDAANEKWTYDPVKYWPNEFGDNAKSNDIDYVSFFAYAPYVDFNPMTGVAPAGEDAEQQQWKNITSASRNGDLGDPLIRYMVDTNPQTSVDLLWGVAANDKFKGLAPAATTTPLKEGGCYLNLSKQVGVDDKIEWRFHHALSKLKVEIIAATDVATEGTDEYVPADGATAIDAATRVYLRWIEFQGFAMSGALNLYSATPLSGTVPTAKWMSYDGATDLKITTVRFNDGLFDGKEGIADNVNSNERVLGELNDTIIEKSTPAEGWQAKNPGIPTAKYTNLFANAKDGKDCIYVIPTSSPVKISMLYDMETADKRVSKYLSDGKTTGVRIANEISKNLDNLKFEAGKAYSIKIVVGMESVKVTAEVKDWGDAETNPTDVDMPDNPATLIGSINIDTSRVPEFFNVGMTATLATSVVPPTATDPSVTWSSSDTDIATIDPKTGEITAKAPGTVTITATANDGSGTTQTTTITVKQPVTSLTVNTASVPATINVGETATLNTNALPANATDQSVTWTSSNPDVATIDPATGVITPVKPGTVTFTATANDDSELTATTATITVKQPVTGLTINTSAVPATFNVGQTADLSATATPSTATDASVTWTSSNTDVATIDATGKLTAKGPGTTTITATAKDGSGKTATATITVKQPVTGLTINATSVPSFLKIGDTATLTVTTQPANASDKSVTWASDNTDVATVDATGKVTAKAPGTATITVTAHDGSGVKQTVNITVKPTTTGALSSYTVKTAEE